MGINRMTFNRIMIFLLIVVMVVSMAACGNNDSRRKRGTGEAALTGDENRPQGDSDRTQTGKEGDGSESADLPEEKTDPEIILSFADDALLLCAKGDKFIEYVNDIGFSINFFDNKEDAENGVYPPKATISVSSESDQRKRVSACTYRVERIDDNNNAVYPETVEMDVRYESPGLTKNSIIIKIPDRSFSEYVKTLKYVIAEKTEYSGDDHERICLSEIKDCIKTYDPEKGYEIIPDEFKTAEYDKEFFMPETEKVRIVQVDVPNCRFQKSQFFSDEYGFIWYGADGREAVDYATEVKIIYMISYDDFGPMHGKA